MHSNAIHYIGLIISDSDLSQRWTCEEEGESRMNERRKGGLRERESDREG